MNQVGMFRNVSRVGGILIPAVLVGLCACFAPSEEGDEAVASAGDELVAGEQTIFDSAIPNVPADPDTADVELGLKFRSSAAGKVTGVRFFKGTGNTGTHVGSLWSAAGVRLGTVTFANESASGWQLARFASPIAVSPNTTYVVSYHAPRGHYAGDNQGMASARTSGALTGLADGQDGPNGVYRYGSSGMPRDSYLASNYYVDVVFRPETMPVADAGVTDSGSTDAVTAATTYGWQLTSSNTGLSGVGIDRNTLPVYTGSISSGMTLSMVKINSTVDLSKLSNVTLDRVWLRPTNDRYALIVGPGTVIKDSDLDGSGYPIDQERIGIYSNTSSGTTYSIQGVNITGMSIGAWLDGSGTGTMTDSYLHGFTSIGAHVDGFTRRAGSGPLTISRCRIDTSGNYVTGAFFLQTTWGSPVGGVTVQDTYLEGEGYVFTLSNTGAGIAFGAKNVRVRAAGWGAVTSGGPITYNAWDVYTYDPTKADAKGVFIDHQ